MMMDCIIRRKRVLTIIVLAIFFALGARAQEDEDIAHSLNLTEVVEMKQKLTDKQIASFLKHDWMLSTNMYDKFYKMVRDKAKDLQKMRKKKRDDVDFRYVGSYTSGNRTFYIVKLDNVRVHIADGCWQISRMSYHEGQNDMQYEFKEIKPDLFLLSHGKAKLYIDKEKWPQGFVSLKLDYDYR